MSAPYPMSLAVLDVLMTGRDLSPAHQEWQELSGGVGRLSDHVCQLRRYLRRQHPHLHILTTRRAMDIGTRRTVVGVYHLEQSQRVTPQLELPGFELMPVHSDQEGSKPC